MNFCQSYKKYAVFIGDLGETDYELDFLITED